MNDYISREAALIVVKTWNGQKDCSVRLKLMVDDLEMEPAADVRPVVRGKWVHHAGGYSDHYDCTACGKDFVKTGKWNYCPNCGADMREVNHETADR